LGGVRWAWRLVDVCLLEPVLSNWLAFSIMTTTDITLLVTQIPVLGFVTLSAFSHHAACILGLLCVLGLVMHHLCQGCLASFALHCTNDHTVSKLIYSPTVETPSQISGYREDYRSLRRCRRSSFTSHESSGHLNRKTGPYGRVAPYDIVILRVSS
jgi:hypothetical protein